MAFILNTELSETKPIYISIQKIYGIGLSLSLNVCKKNGINPHSTLKQLSNKKIQKIFYFIETHFLINDNLKQKTIQNKLKLKQIKHYRGKKK